MMKRKGQGAMEYLMTYGWAILVVMIVGVVLWQLGIFGGGPGAVNTARGFGKVKVFDPSIKYSSGTLGFTIMNGAGTAISGLKITPTGSGCGAVTGIPPDNMLAGSTAGINITCGSKGKGESFSVQLEINYSEIQDVKTNLTAEVDSHKRVVANIQFIQKFCDTFPKKFTKLFCTLFDDLPNEYKNLYYVTQIWSHLCSSVNDVYLEIRLRNFLAEYIRSIRNAERAQVQSPQ